MSSTLAEFQNRRRCKHHKSGVGSHPTHDKSRAQEPSNRLATEIGHKLFVAAKKSLALVGIRPVKRPSMKVTTAVPRSLKRLGDAVGILKVGTLEPLSEEIAARLENKFTEAAHGRRRRQNSAGDVQNGVRALRMLVEEFNGFLCR